jgi:hypothetical protein
MAAFFIGRDFNAHPGLPWYRNDRAIIISLGNKRDEVTKPIFLMISSGAIWMGAAFARSYTPDTIKTCGKAVAKLGQRLASPFLEDYACLNHRHGPSRRKPLHEEDRTSPSAGNAE